MKKQHKVLLVLAASVVLVGVGATLFWTTSYLVTREQFDAIDVGMTRADIEGVLGGPPRNCVDNPVIVWVPQADGRRISAEIPPGTPAVRFFPNAKSPDNSLEAVWLTETGLIAAYFGNDGRLQQKYFSTVHEISPPSFMDWLKTRRLFP